VPPFPGCRTHEPHRRQRTCPAPSSSCAADRPARLSWPKPPDGPSTNCSNGSGGRRGPSRTGREEHGTPTWSGTHRQAQLSAGKTPCARRPDHPPPSAGSTDRTGRPSLGRRGITGAWDSNGPDCPPPTTRPNAAAAAAVATAAPGSRQEPLARQQHATGLDTDRPAESTAYGQPARTHPAAGRPPPGNDHHPDGNNGRGHHGATAPGVFPARTNCRSTGRPAVSRRNASPTAPTPEGEANPHRETHSPICPVRGDTSGLGTVSGPRIAPRTVPGLSDRQPTAKPRSGTP
jgi:hypothetical protein